MEFYGRVHEVSEPQIGTSEKGNWKLQTVVVESFEQPTIYVAFDAFNKNCEQLSSVKVGQAVKAVGSAQSRKSDKGWFTSLNLWTITPL